MISQNCPKCLSKRVRRGYRPTPLWSKIFFRYNLLCDNCNWEFVGFAVPGTVSAKPTKSPKKKPVNKPTENLHEHTANSFTSNLQNESAGNLQKESVENTGSLESQTEKAENSGPRELQKESEANLTAPKNVTEMRVKKPKKKKKAKRKPGI